MDSFINSKQLGQLYYDEVFFTYDEPQLFLCKNIVGQIFLGVLSDIEPRYIWYLSPISLATVAQLKSQRIDLYSIYTKPELGYVWKVEEEDDDVNLTILEPSQIPEEDIPTQGYYLNYPIGSTEKPNLTLQAIEEKRDVFEMSIEKGNSHLKEISCENLGAILSDTQQLIYALALESNQAMGPIPKNIKEHCSLQVVDTFAASFGIRMKSDDLADISMKTPVTNALTSLLDLLKIKDDAGGLASFFSNKSRRAIIKYRDLLRSISNAESGINIEGASPNQNYCQIHYSKDEINRNLSLLRREVDKITEIKSVEGRLIGIEVKDKNSTFKFIANSDEYIKGKISDALSNEVFEVPHNATIKVEQSIGTDPFTHEDIYLYKLLSFELND